jgi:hypothetical protein
MDFVFILVPIFFPKIIVEWILFVILYLLIGFYITVNEGKKVKKDLNID